MIGIYVHVPFCKRKCPYCSFYSVVADQDTRESYCQALVRNISSFKGRGLRADTLYFGGGTPSLLEPEQVSRIIGECRDSFGEDITEITLEANPSSVSYDKLCRLREAGVNRLSVGFQSADDEQLRFLGRLHDVKAARETVLSARKAGFENISADVMIGLAGQDKNSLEETINKLTKLPLEHISAYMLSIEEGTAFDCDRVRSSTADEELMGELYSHMCQMLEDKGFEHYEISNFARNGRYSKHNLKYWQGEEYLGFGAAAHSFFEGKRYRCPDDVESFISSPLQPCEILEEQVDPLEEYVMLGLRLSQGVKLDRVRQLSDAQTAGRILKKAQVLASYGLCRVQGNRIALTEKGFLLSNSVICELLYRIDKNRGC